MPTDKTNRFCTIDSTTVEQKIKDHLDGWEQLPGDPTTAFEKAANTVLTNALNEIGVKNNTYLARRMKSQHSSAPVIYPLGKDHKPSFPDTKVRIVQPVTGSAVEHLDRIVGKVLTQILPRLRYRVDSSRTFIDRCLTPHRDYTGYMCSFDVESMYPTLPTCSRALDILRSYLERYEPEIDLLGFSPDHITQFMSFVTKHTYATAGREFLPTEIWCGHWIPFQRCLQRSTDRLDILECSGKHPTGETPNLPRHLC
eukprot:sb/3468591/